MLILIEQNFDPLVASQFAVQYKCIPAENPSKIRIIIMNDKL